MKMNSKPSCPTTDASSHISDKRELDSPPRYCPSALSCGNPRGDERSAFSAKSIVSVRSSELTSLTPVKGPTNYDYAYHRIFPSYSRMFPVGPSHTTLISSAEPFPPTFFSAPRQDFMAAFPQSVIFRPGLPFLPSPSFQPYFPKPMQSSSPEARTTHHDPKKCQMCEKSYTRMSTLKLHMRAHSGEKPHQCLVCLKSFSQAANLTAHFRIHSGEKPFKCRVCDRRFSQSSSVTTHMRTHNGERPYKCRVCGKAFADSSTLTKHTRTHTGEKPYQCDICSQRFSQSGNLNRHKRIHSDC